MDVNDHPASLKKARLELEKKAHKCILVATKLLGKTASQVAIENQALDFMDLPNDKLDNMLRNAGGFLLAEEEMKEDHEDMDKASGYDYLDDMDNDMYMAGDHEEMHMSEEDMMLSEMLQEEEMKHEEMAGDHEDMGYMAEDHEDMHMSEEDMMLSEMLQEEEMKHRMAAEKSAQIRTDRRFASIMDTLTALTDEVRSLRASLDTLEEAKTAGKEEEGHDKEAKKEEHDEEEMKAKKAEEEEEEHKKEAKDEEHDEEEMKAKKAEEEEEGHEKEAKKADDDDDEEDEDKDEKDEDKDEEEEKKEDEEEGHDKEAAADPMAWIDMIPSQQGVTDLHDLYNDRVAADIDFASLEREASMDVFASEEEEGHDKEARVRPQNKTASNGAQTLGNVTQTKEASELEDLASLWDSAPDVSDHF
ncbi:MAG: hypothetical protein AAGM67_01425 [Bacteroidota bacterium]